MYTVNYSAKLVYPCCRRIGSVCCADG